MSVYWRLSNQRQNQVLLIASYFFYGLWDYHFLFLILTSTLIDYIGGLGISGIRLSRRRLIELFVLFQSSALLLCVNINYPLLCASLIHRDVEGVSKALPHSLNDLSIFLAALGACAVYAILLPFLYSASEKRRRVLFLTISIVGNLAILCFFKYYDFFVTSLKALFITIGLGNPGFVTLNLILPVGISFFTFQAMSYPIDIYRGQAQPTTHFSDFALFVCFFPNLLAGPIMRAQTLLPQILKERFIQPGAITEGFNLIMLGLFKKLVIADNMALIANRVFLPIEDGLHITGSGLDVLVGVYAFAFQIYGDFAGYSAIARGISKLLGFELLINFDNPYLATTPSDLWRRWHISLSSWFRDYLYIPLGGNRHGQRNTLRNLMITMGCVGLWHGANWTFILWGLYHGAILAIARLFKMPDVTFAGTIKNKLHYLFRVILMFHLICLGWLFFRADSIHTIGKLLKVVVTEFHMTAFAASGLFSIVFYCAPLFVFEVWTSGEKQLNKLSNGHWAVQSGLYCYLLTMLIVFHSERIREFIYFQF
jgi:D-alanyl-lipoteichoic acid acyltransferase DltB (MBOAT superfamily)